MKTQARTLIASLAAVGIATACAVSPVPPEAHPIHVTAAFEAKSNRCLESGLIKAGLHDQIQADAQVLKSWMNVADPIYIKRVDQAEQAVQANTETCHQVVALAPRLRIEARYLASAPSNANLLADPEKEYRKVIYAEASRPADFTTGFNAVPLPSSNR